MQGRGELLMPMGSEKSDDAHRDNRHKRPEADHNEVERGHDGCSVNLLPRINGSPPFERAS